MTDRRFSINDRVRVTNPEKSLAVTWRGQIGVVVGLCEKTDQGHIYTVRIDGHEVALFDHELSAENG